MYTHNPERFSASELGFFSSTFAQVAPQNILSYFGVVNYATNERVLEGIKQHLIHTPSEELYMMVTSTGGPTGSAMSFYDTVHYVLRPSLTTIGSGDVDSSGILIFLSGKRRFITPHTTLLLHPAGRSFEPGKRFEAREIAAMASEDTYKDMQYASVVAEHSPTLTPKKVLSMMQKHTVLSAEELVGFGLAEKIL